jgi:zinc protease
MPSPFPTQAPAIDLSQALDFPEFEVQRIASGQVVHLLARSQNPLSKLSLRYSIDAEWMGRPFHLNTLVQLLGEGTEQKTAAEWNAALDRCGAFVQKSVNRESLVFSVVCRSQNLAQALPLFREMLMESSLDKDEFDMQKELQISDFMQESEQVSEQVRRLSSAYLFKGHPLFQDERLEELQDMRLDQVQASYQLLIRGQAPEAFASGVEPKDLQALNAFLASLPTPAESQTKITQWSIPTATDLHFPMPGKSQQALRVVGPAPSKNVQEELKFRFMLVLWGGYFGSRLMKNIREEKGYTYGINASHIRLKSASYWMVNTQINAGKKEETLNEMRREAQRLMQGDVGAEEIETVRNYMAGSLARSLDGVLNRHDRLMGFYGLGYPANYLPMQHQSLFEIEANDIQAAAQKWINPEHWICASAG